MLGHLWGKKLLVFHYMINQIHSIQNFFLRFKKKKEIDTIFGMFLLHKCIFFGILKGKRRKSLSTYPLSKIVISKQHINSLFYDDLVLTNKTLFFFLFLKMSFIHSMFTDHLKKNLKIYINN